MSKLNGLKIGLCQMPVIPGRPDLNSRYMRKEIQCANERGLDMIIFPEMSVSGYLLGDKPEDDTFVRDVQRENNNIIESTRFVGGGGKKSANAIFGTITINPHKKGRDGRMRKYNSALLAEGGRLIGKTSKTLQPDYQVFDDDRHFYSISSEILEGLASARDGIESTVSIDIRDYFKFFTLDTNIGPIRVAVIICEDLWAKNYPFNPGKIIAEMGVDLLVAISQSPFSWQKNRRRHQEVKSLAAACREAGCPVPIVYVNNVGIQNNVKTIVIFDGASTIYNEDGDIVFEVEPYVEGTFDFAFGDNVPVLEPREEDDSRDLFEALEYAGKKHVESLDASLRKIVIGISGGIDSSVAAAYWAHIVGPKNVHGFSMPGPYTSDKTIGLGKRLAKNLGINFDIIPITDAADLIAKKTGIQRGTDAYGNIMARLRREILSAQAEKLGGVISCNGNKVENAVGYCTRYGDNAGFLAIFGDCLKREVYQAGDYLNRVIYQRGVIPAECFKIKPTAELKEAQTDPFYYGNLEGYNYHDQLIRAWVEFRWSPETVLEHYIKGTLEKEFRLNEKHLAQLFVTPHDFVKDLERCWRLYHIAISKRGEGPPIPKVSRRSFGFDLRESMVSPHLTIRYYDLKMVILSRPIEKKRIVIFGGSFRPTSLAHLSIARRLSETFDKVIVVPCGSAREDKIIDDVPDSARKLIAETAFAVIPKVRLDTLDLDKGSFTHTWELQKIYQEEFPDAQIWHVVGGDIIAGGHDGNSEIQRVWERGNYIWSNLNFVVIHRPGYVVERHDLPPSSELVQIEGIFGSGTLIRSRLSKGEPIDDLVSPETKDLIKSIFGPSQISVSD